ncbi:unnamed protein product [Closterium sp. Naga37s-1]|nr:unnamed protein product [Closterium sp. Naga37s-1]
MADNDLAFNVSHSNSFQAFVDAAVNFAKPYTLPTPYRVSGPLLAKLRADTEALVQPLKDSWNTSGCSLSVDGWTCIKSRGMVCVIALNDTAPVIVEVVDSKTAKKTGAYLAGLIGDAIRSVGGHHVVQVVMDNASNNKRAAELLKPEVPHVFFTNCAAHVLDLMLHDCGKVRAVRRVLAQVHRVVMMVKGSASAVVLFRTLFTKLSLVRPGATRFGTQVIMVGRFLEVKRALKAMVISEEWEQVAVARSKEGQAVRTLLLDDVFWELVVAVQRLMTPVYEVLRAVDKRSLLMGQIYGLMLEATVKTNEAAEAAGRPSWQPSRQSWPRDRAAAAAALELKEDGPDAELTGVLQARLDRIESFPSAAGAMHGAAVDGAPLLSPGGVSQNGGAGGACGVISPRAQVAREARSGGAAGSGSGAVFKGNSGKPAVDGGGSAMGSTRSSRIESGGPNDELAGRLRARIDKIETGPKCDDLNAHK